MGLGRSRTAAIWQPVHSCLSSGQRQDSPSGQRIRLEVDHEIEKPTRPRISAPANYTVDPGTGKGDRDACCQKRVAIDDAAVFEEQVIGKMGIRDPGDHVSVDVDASRLTELDRAVQLVCPNIRISKRPGVLPGRLNPKRQRQRIRVRINEGRRGFGPSGPGARATLVVKRIEALQFGRVRVVPREGLVAQSQARGPRQAR